MPRTACTSPGRKLAAAYLLLVSGSLGIGLTLGPSSVGAVGTTDVAYLTPGATGTACTVDAPCGSLDQAIAVSVDGGKIIASGGDYGSQKLTSAKSTWAVKNVSVTSAPGQTATFGSLTINRPGLTFQNVSFYGFLKVADGPTVLDGIKMIGGANAGAILIRGDDVTVRNSEVSGGYAHDGINVAGYPDRVHDVLIENNSVHDIGGDTNSHDEHPDCLQIFDAYDVTIRRNNLYDCYNSGITFSPGARRGIDHVKVESNFIQGCIAARQRCGNGGSAMDLRVGVAANSTPVSAVTIDHNTFGTGSVRVPYQPGVTGSDNIVGYLSVASPCTTSLSNSMISGYPSFACKNGTPGQTTTSNSGNIGGKAAYVNAEEGNLHLAEATSVTATYSAIQASSTSAPVDNNQDVIDIDGERFTSEVMGADQPNAHTPGVPSAGPVTTTTSSNSTTASSTTSGVSSSSSGDSTASSPAKPSNSDGRTHTGSDKTKVAIRRILTSAASASRWGWYRTPVEVSYRCYSSTSPLRTVCPAEMRLASTARHTVGAHEIVAADGASASVDPTVVQIDRQAPRVHLHFGGPSERRVRCVAHDSVSGVASCRVAVRTTRFRVHYTATATDRAGNVGVVRRSTRR